MATAEDCKAKGNAAFHAKNFTEAVEWYGKAIAIDGRNAVFFNNRAAAYLELRKFTEAAADAEKSAILSPSAKANARHGRALWNLGQKTAALQAYERALRLDPGNSDYESAVKSLKSSGSGTPEAPPPQQNAARPSARAFQLDLAVLVAGVAFLPLMLFAPGLSHTVWLIAVGAFLVRQLLTIVATTRPEQLRSFAFWKEYATTRATSEFAGQYLALCVAFVVTSAPPQQFLFLAMVLYAAVDLVTAQRAQLDAVIRGNRFEHLVAPRIQQAIANRQQLFLQAAACEAMSLFTMPLSGCPMIAMFVVMQFIKWRYRADPWAQHAWRGLHMQVQQLTRHPRCPQVVGRAYDKMAELLHRAGSS
eukprot:CAMPEP_0174854766 /NCGR_PEP_ID=MMETSP1114-20130205/31937_1 /TAXON_ID=312471 /ORGANISM="Neobodo designis, Strain CCAP 1951/1" /LENGTH=361 /DNA_ID=CAMNT_0016089475 /DNA_START=40 /DNA_END=1128 /DNA_ORIENTATION=-